MFKGYIYRHWLVNDKGIEKNYIGQTINSLQVRWQSNGKGYLINEQDSKFAKAIRKYGWNNFTHEVILTIKCETKEELKFWLNQWEAYYIEKYDSFYNGYNSTTGGDGCLLSEETKQKMSDSATSKIKVICLNTSEIFDSISDAYKWATGRCDVANVGTRIGACCRGEAITAYRHPDTGERLTWAYLEDYEYMTQYEIDDRLNKSNHAISLEDEVNIHTTDEKQNLHTGTLEDRLSPLYKIFTKKQITVFNEYFLDGKTIEEIASTYNVSTNAIWKTKKTIEDRIRERYTEASFAELIELR